MKIKNFKKSHIGEGLNRIELMNTVVPEQKIKQLHSLFQSKPEIQSLLFDWFPKRNSESDKPKGFLSVKAENLLKFKEVLANAQK